METTQEYQLAQLEESEMLDVIGGYTGSGPLAHDMGMVLGAAVGAFMRIGESLYRSGGITGGNPWLR